MSVSFMALFAAGCGLSRYEPVAAGADGGRGVPIILLEGEGGTQAENSPDLWGEGAVFLFAGDICFSDYVTQAYEKAGVSGVLDEAYRQEIARADVFFANEEFPFSDRGEAQDDKEYTFRLPPSSVTLLKELGLSGVTLANNHVLDYGREALLDTCDTLDGAGILHTGAGKDLEAAAEPAGFLVNGKNYAVIGASRVTPDAGWFATRYQAGVLSAYQPEELLNRVRELKKNAGNEAVIAFLHWGVEREETPQETQRTLGRQLIDAGADLVIGAHPHVLQGIEYYQGKPIVYSLGNFIFGSSIPKTALLRVTFADGEEPVLTLLPGKAALGYTQMLNTEEQRQEFYRWFESISYGITIDENGTVSALEQ